VWDEAFCVYVDKDDTELVLAVWSYDLLGENEFLGRVVVDLLPLHTQSGSVRQGRQALVGDSERFPNVIPTGTITFEVTPQYIDNTSSSTATAPSSSKNASGSSLPNARTPPAKRITVLDRLQKHAQTLITPNNADAKGGHRKWRKRAAESELLSNVFEVDLDVRIKETQGELYLMGAFSQEIQQVTKLFSFSHSILTHVVGFAFFRSSKKLLLGLTRRRILLNSNREVQVQYPGLVIHRAILNALRDSHFRAT
jgi:hypothetical protein